MPAHCLVFHHSRYEPVAALAGSVLVFLWPLGACLSLPVLAASSLPFITPFFLFQPCLLILQKLLPPCTVLLPHAAPPAAGLMFDGAADGAGAAQEPASRCPGALRVSPDLSLSLLIPASWERDNFRLV